MGKKERAQDHVEEIRRLNNRSDTETEEAPQWVVQNKQEQQRHCTLACCVQVQQQIKSWSMNNKEVTIQHTKGRILSQQQQNVAK